MFDHDHHHASHAHPAHSGAFAWGIGLNVLFVVVELYYGFLSHSLALIADASHNATDVLGLLLAWGALALTKIKPSRNFTYGLQSASIFASLINAMLIMLAVGALAMEAFDRFMNPAQVDSSTVMVVAAVGIAINALTAWFFHREASRDLNIRGAYLHMVADAMVSAGVVVGALIGQHTGWMWIDPALTLLIAVVIIGGTWSLLADSLRLVLSGVPKHINIDEVHAFLSAFEGVSEVHDLHIWALGTTETSLSAHLRMPAGHPGDAFLRNVILALEERFHIHHATIQIEMGDFTDVEACC